MGWVTGIAVYLMIWWLVIFMVLPWGVRRISDDDVVQGQDAGAPRKTNLGWKLLITTVIATVLWIITYFIIDSGAISFRE